MEQYKLFIQIIIIRIKKKDKIKSSLGRTDRESVEEREKEFYKKISFFVSFSDLRKLDCRFSSE